jgi:hypothetical protein
MEKKASIYVYRTPYIVDNLMERCIEDNVQDLNVQMLVAWFEEEMIKNLDESLSSQNFSNMTNNLQAMLSEIARELNVNIKVFVGHIEICTDFLQDIQDDFDLQDVSVRGPQLILLIGCHGADYAVEANHESIYEENQTIILGFDDLIHLYDGDIIGCKLPHLTFPNIRCEYDTVKKDYADLVEKYKKNGSFNQNNLHTATFNVENPLVNCCRSKLTRFKSVFLNSLRKRQCVKFTKESLLTKMKNLVNSDGTLNFTKLGKPSNYIYYYEDGVPCENPLTCTIKNPYSFAEKNAQVFNERGLLYKLFIQIWEQLSSSAEKTKLDENMLKFLERLREEEKKIYDYSLDGYTVLSILAENKALKCVDYILKKKLSKSLTVQAVDTGNTFLHFIMEDDLLDEDTKLKFVIRAVEINPEIAEIKNKKGLDILFYTVQRHYISILQYLSEHTGLLFSEHTYTYDPFENANLLFVSCAFKSWNTEVSYQLVKLLLIRGVDPNQLIYGNKDIFSYYFEYQPPIVFPKVLKELCLYGFENKNSVKHLISSFKDVLTNPQEEIHYKKMLFSWVSNTNNFNEKNERERTLNNFKDLVELYMYKFKPITLQIIKILQECLAIIEKGGKPLKARIMNINRTMKRTRENIEIKKRSVFAKNLIPLTYQEIDAYIKSVGAKFTKAEKQKFREEGLALLQNTNGNALTRLEKLEDLRRRIEEEATKESRGGSYTRKRKY